jgi:hypothetical protein
MLLPSAYIGLILASLFLLCFGGGYVITRLRNRREEERRVRRERVTELLSE